MIMGGKGFRTYEDLRGATIGSSTFDLRDRLSLKKNVEGPWPRCPRDYTLISVGGSGPAFTALSTDSSRGDPRRSH